LEWNDFSDISIYNIYYEPLAIIVESPFNDVKIRPFSTVFL